MKAYADRVAALAARGGSVLDVEVELRTALDDARRAEAEATAALHAAHLASFQPPPAPADVGELHARLTSVVEDTHAKARSDRDAQVERVDAKRRELQPVADHARAIAAELEELKRAHGELATSLVSTDFFKLRGSVDPRSLRAEWLLNQLDRTAREVYQALFGTAAQLDRVPERIHALTPAQLVTTSETPSPGERIAHDVRSMAAAPRLVTEGLRVLTRHLQELDRFRLSEPVPVKTIARPQPTRPPWGQVAVTEYSVHAPSNTVRR